MQSWVVSPARTALLPRARQTTCTWRPRCRLRLMIFRPFLVFMRLRKPMRRARFTFEIFLG